MFCFFLLLVDFFLGYFSVFSIGVLYQSCWRTISNFKYI